MGIPLYKVASFDADLPHGSWELRPLAGSPTEIPSIFAVQRKD
jgi:hypothetical protein